MENDANRIPNSVSLFRSARIFCELSHLENRLGTVFAATGGGTDDILRRYNYIIEGMNNHGFLFRGCFECISNRFEVVSVSRIPIGLHHGAHVGLNLSSLWS
jgi:hypothetical protein